jgi:hypothetical protein
LVEDAVFTAPAGRPVDGTWAIKWFHRALDQAGLPQVRIHDLRHTAATHLLRRGVHPKVVQELLGHSTISLTLDRYSHVVPALHAEVAVHMIQRVAMRGACFQAGPLVLGARFGLFEFQAGQPHECPLRSIQQVIVNKNFINFELSL